jgi:hypothetical protein
MDIERPVEIETKATELVKLGCSFDVEILRTGLVNMEVMRNGDCVCGELCSNGPAVPEHVDKLINRAYDIVVNAQDEEEE